VITFPRSSISEASWGEGRIVFYVVEAVASSAADLMTSHVGKARDG
jgi:hypothetical protein